MREPTWQELYKAALLELDPQKVNERAEAARWAVHRRLTAEEEPITAEEYGKIDDHTLGFNSKKDSEITVSCRIVVSADGKSRTVTASGTDQGKKFHERCDIYDKQ